MWRPKAPHSPSRAGYREGSGSYSRVVPRCTQEVDHDSNAITAATVDRRASDGREPGCCRSWCRGLWQGQRTSGPNRALSELQQPRLPTLLPGPGRVRLGGVWLWIEIDGGAGALSGEADIAGSVCGHVRGEGGGATSIRGEFDWWLSSPNPSGDLLFLDPNDTYYDVDLGAFGGVASFPATPRPLLAASGPRGGHRAASRPVGTSVVRDHGILGGRRSAPPPALSEEASDRR